MTFFHCCEQLICRSFGLITPKEEFRVNVCFSLLNCHWQEDACHVPPWLPVIGCSHMHVQRTSCCGGWWRILCSVSAQRDNIWGPFLIISPASTLNNWHQEFSRFVPKFKVSIHDAADWARQWKRLQKHVCRNPGILFSAVLFSCFFYSSNELSTLSLLGEILSIIWELRRIKHV